MVVVDDDDDGVGDGRWMTMVGGIQGFNNE